MVEVPANTRALTHLDRSSVLANKVTSYKLIEFRAVDLLSSVFVRARAMAYA